tara:strand:- start:184542 stop:184697 length:156 start_codon:yes stop_codon:yes gene_type:complete
VYDDFTIELFVEMDLWTLPMLSIIQKQKQYSTSLQVIRQQSLGGLVVLKGQ